MPREMKRCFVDAYKLTDDDFLRMASQATPSWKDGSTAVTVLVLDNVLYCANVGDSKAYLCRRLAGGKLGFVPLTKEHSPSLVRMCDSEELGHQGLEGDGHQGLEGDGHRGLEGDGHRGLEGDGHRGLEGDGHQGLEGGLGEAGHLTWKGLGT